MYFLIFRTDAILLGHYRLSQDTDNQTKVFAVITKKKEEVSIQGGISSFLFISKMFIQAFIRKDKNIISLFILLCKPHVDLWCISEETWRVFKNVIIFSWICLFIFLQTISFSGPSFSHLRMQSQNIL